MTSAEGDDPIADFSELDGIGSKTADALRAAGITTMGQLARTRVAELARRLRLAGSSIPESRIIEQRWLFQALERATEPSGPNPPDESGAEQPDEPDNAAPPWIEHASFILCFDRRSTADDEQWQTRVWDTRGMVEEEIPGTAAGPWVDFITKAAGLPTDG